MKTTEKITVIEHLRILQEHLNLYLDCVEANDISSLKTFLTTNLGIINNSINLLNEQKNEKY